MTLVLVVALKRPRSAVDSGTRRPHFERERRLDKRMRRSLSHRRRWTHDPVYLSLLMLWISNSLLSGASLDSNLKKMTEIVDALKRQFGISNLIQVRIVENERLVFSVQPARIPGDFVLSVDSHFLDQLSDEELEAALAHELGHVWIYTHHPFLHTEGLANRIAMKVVLRDSLKKLYAKLWQFEGSSGNLEELLGTEPPATLTAVGH
jgi:hypothetical protein